jgi:hypothetical protein
MTRSLVPAAATAFALVACHTGGAPAPEGQARAAEPGAPGQCRSPDAPVCCQAGAMATPSTARCVASIEACRARGGLPSDRPERACA